MSVDLLGLGISGLLSSQQQLGTTGHNIANVNTEGYSRQTANQQTTNPVRAGSNFIGTGTQVSDVSRVFDQFVHKEVIFNQTNNSAAQTTAQKMQQLDNTMSTSGQAVTESINGLFSAVNALVDVPGDLGLRHVMISKADTLSATINSVASALNSEYEAINEELDATTQRVTEIAHQLSSLNRDIVTATASNATPSDLLDKRDGLIKELAQYTTLSTIETEDGALNVYIANGQTLVTGTTHFSIGVEPGTPDPRQTQLYIQSPAGAKQALSNNNVGGNMGALIDIRDGILTDTINQVGLSAISVADAFNTAQAQGVDLNGLQGQNLYKDINDQESMERRFLANNHNDGNLMAVVEINDINSLTNHEYSLQYSAGSYTLLNQTTGQSQQLIADDPLAAEGSRSYTSPDGFRFIERSGAPQEGDKYSIQPTRLGANNLTVNLTTPEQIATSSLVETYSDTNNVNTASLSITSVDDPTHANFPTADQPLTLQVYETPQGTFNYSMLDSAGNAQELFDANGNTLGTSATYSTSPFNFSAAGMSFSLAGQASGQGVNAPERYSINYAVGAGNNKNILAMASLVDEKLAGNSHLTMTDLYEEAVTSVGSATEIANIEASATQTLYTQATMRMSNTSGVNIDEEASNLMRFQQSYSASARVISTANEIFQTLLDAAR